MARQSQPKSKKPESGLSAFSRALRLLARREHTRLELERKLTPHVADAAELQALLDDFTARGFLSESRAVEQLVRLRRERMGSARIRQVLRERGVSNELIAGALDGLKDSEVERARRIWARRFAALPENGAERARQVRFLQFRGFSVETALRVLRARTDETAD